MDAVEVGRLAQAARQGVDAPGLGEGQGERAGEELVAPVNLPRWAARQRFAQYSNESRDQRVEVLRHQHRRPFRRIVDLRDQRAITLPSRTAARRTLQ